MEPYVVGLALVVVLPRPRAQFHAHAHRSVQLPQLSKHVFPEIVTPSNVGEYVEQRLDPRSPGPGSGPRVSMPLRQVVNRQGVINIFRNVVSDGNAMTLGEVR